MQSLLLPFIFVRFISVKNLQKYFTLSIHVQDTFLFEEDLLSAKIWEINFEI